MADGGGWSTIESDEVSGLLAVLFPGTSFLTDSPGCVYLSYRDSRRQRRTIRRTHLSRCGHDTYAEVSCSLQHPHDSLSKKKNNASIAPYTASYFCSNGSAARTKIAALRRTAHTTKPPPPRKGFSSQHKPSKMHAEPKPFYP